MRIDVYLVSAGYAPSRQSAKRLIEEGLVTLDGKVITKPASEVIKPGLAICLPNYFTACQKVISEELGKEVHLKTSLGLVYNILRCLILL